MEVKKEDLRKETPDMTQTPLDDAKLEEATGGATATGLIRDDCWTCPGCRTLYSEKNIPRCPKCGYEN